MKLLQTSGTLQTSDTAIKVFSKVLRSAEILLTGFKK